MNSGQNRQKLLKLPIGIQTFEQLREGGYIYVDKTRYLIELIDSGKVYFLSRPRRFGKSITVSTFDALFSGKHELFKGLYAEEYFARPEYRTHPVVHLDMSQVVTDQDMTEMRMSMFSQVLDNAERHNVVIPEYVNGNPAVALKELLKKTSQKHGPVVVLIDEYDKPILDVLDNSEQAEEHRKALRSFYTQIKAEDANIRFVFMTGITKFTRAGVFSAMNNLKDISMTDKYATMLGYTESELASNFDAHIERSAEKLGITKEELLKEIKNYYDGFSFDGVNRLYNPFSTLNFFDESAFKNFWFESGSPSFLIKYVKTHDIEAEDFRGKVEHEEFTSVTEIELAKPSSFLFQAGYLTVREKRESRLTLDYPNKEVLSSMADLFLYSKYGNRDSGVIRTELEEALSKGDAEAIVTIYNQTLSAIPYDIYDREEAKYERERTRGLISYNLAESFYHAVLFTLLWASKATTVAENHSYRGRSDVEIIFKEHRYIAELKVAEGKEAAERAADEALAQIRAKGYADKYPSAKLLGIAVDRAARQVGAYRIECGV